MKPSIRFTLALVMSATLLGGCGDSGIQRKTQELCATSSGVAARLKAFYLYINVMHANNIRRELDMRSNPAFAKDALGDAKLTLSPPVSDAELRAREATAKGLESYATQIDVIARSKSAAEIDGAISNLNTRIQELTDQIPDTAANGAVGILKKLVISNALNTVAKTAFSIFRENWTRQSIVDSKDAFQRDCHILESELHGAADAAKLEAASMVGDQRRRLETNKGNLSETDRKAFLTDIQRSLDDFQSIGTKNPAADLASMATTDQQLFEMVDKNVEKKRTFKLPWGN